MTIQWFPGHMQKARREMEEQLKLVDIVIEIRDARMPLASSNPLLNELGKNKPRLIILNKDDMSDPKENENWKKYFDEEYHCLLANSLNDNLNKVVADKVKDILKDKLEKAKARGIRKKVLRCMVVGIPNVGKSTFINNVVKKKVAKAENRPGVTKNLQWVRIHEDLELLDTPGVLWPKFEDENVARVLALLGSINDDILDKQALVNYGLTYLKKEYLGIIAKRYTVNEDSDKLVEDIAKSKLWLSSNGDVDLNKTYQMILKDIRNNNLGRVSYEKYVTE